ncbi:MAG TPA: GNAT family N-acetyltransferase [Chloroflexota bacterium]|nr:GNAT family N-acetyltransferase [Chloroflexota bacterium]
MTVRRLAADELTGVYAIDMTESGDTVYRIVDDQLQSVAEKWQRPPRTKKRWDDMIARWRNTLERGGEAWGAYDNGRMVAIAVLRYRLSDDVAELAALFVSRPYRRRGIARRLTQTVLDAAHQSGASSVYVSATPSVSAVGFYRRMGFGLAESVNPELYALEPEDIHMVRTV